MSENVGTSTSHNPKGLITLHHLTRMEGDLKEMNFLYTYICSYPGEGSRLILGNFARLHDVTSQYTVISVVRISHLTLSQVRRQGQFRQLRGSCEIFSACKRLAAEVIRAHSDETALKLFPSTGQRINEENLLKNNKMPGTPTILYCIIVFSIYVCMIF
jgi:hypothetical protein